MYVSLLQSAENVLLCDAEYFVLGLVVFVPDPTGHVPSSAVQHVVLELDVSVPDSTGNVPFCAAAHSVLRLVAHEFSFAEYDDDEKRQIFVLLGSLHVQPAFV